MSPDAAQISAVPPHATPEEASALSKVMWFGILQLVGIVAGWAVGIYVFGTVFTSPAALNLGPNPTPAEVSAALGPLFQALALVIPVAVIMELAAMVVLTLGFRELGKVDSSNFSLPSNLMFLMIAGVVLVAAGVIQFFNSIPSIIAQAPSTPGGSPSPAFFDAIGSLVFFFLLLAVGGILSLIGLIGGQILGLWRVGTRYNETVVKIGAIFAVIPMLNIAAPVLVLIGAHEAKGRLAVPS